MGNIGPLKVFWPMIYYMPFSVGGQTVGNICPLTACWLMIFHTPAHSVSAMIYHVPLPAGGWMV